MDRTEWEMLCDGCGKCCLFKLDFKDKKGVSYTNVACRFLDPMKVQCKSYWNRHAVVSTCMILTPSRVEQYSWLPKTCAYRLLYEGKDLPEWHYLVCEDPDEIHRSGYSVKGKVVSEEYVHPKDLESHMTDWE